MIPQPEAKHFHQLAEWPGIAKGFQARLLGEKRLSDRQSPMLRRNLWTNHPHPGVDPQGLERRSADPGMYGEAQE